MHEPAHPAAGAANASPMAKATTVPVASRLLFEALEPRVLLAADPLPAFVVAQVNGSIDAPGEADRYVVNIDSGTRILFDSLTNNSQINWSLSGPNGTVVANHSFASSDSYDFGSANPLLRLEPGEYTFTIDGAGDSTGAYSF